MVVVVMVVVVMVMMVVVVVVVVVVCPVLTALKALLPSGLVPTDFVGYFINVGGR